MAFFTLPAFVIPQLVEPQEKPSRWRLTYAFELQLWTAEGQRAGANVVVNLPINPTELRVSSDFAQKITTTIGGVTAAEGGFVQREIQVTGTCGLAPKTGWSPGSLNKTSGTLAGGGITFADGNTLHRELRRLFEIYSDLVKAGGAVRPRMVWHNFRDKQHWVVIPTKWEETRRAAEHRLHYPYQITMIAVGDDDASGIPGEAGIFSFIRDKVAIAIGAANFLTGLAADAGAFVNEASSTIKNSLVAAISAMRSMAAAVDGIRTGVLDVMTIPRTLAMVFQSTIDTWRRAVGLEFDATGGWTPGDSRSSALAQQYEIAAQSVDAADALVARRELFRPTWQVENDRLVRLRAGESLLSAAELDAAELAASADPRAVQGLATRATPGSRSRLATPPARTQLTRTYQSSRPYEVQVGDTLHGIATREMGNAEAWIDLAVINELTAPYITQTGVPGTVAPGDTIAIPLVGQAPQAADDDDPLGTDFYLSPLRVWEPTADLTDIRVVSGIDNYAQALERMRYLTELGSNQIYPDFGILAPIGSPAGAGMPEAVALSVRRATLADPRTQEITRLDIQDLGDGVGVEIVVVPRGVRDTATLRREVSQ